MNSDARIEGDPSESLVVEDHAWQGSVMTRALEAIREDDDVTIRSCFDWLERPQAEMLLNECATSDAVRCFSALADATFPTSNIRRPVLLMTYICEAVAHDSAQILDKMFALYDNNYVSQSKLFLSVLRHSSEKCFDLLLPRLNPTVVMTSFLDQMSCGQEAKEKFFWALYDKVCEEDLPSVVSSHLSNHHRFLENDWQFLDNFVGELPEPLFEEVYPFVHAHVRDNNLQYIAARRSKIDMMEAVGDVDEAPCPSRPRRM